MDEHETKLGSYHDQIHAVIVKTATNSRNIDNISAVVETKFDRVAQDVVNLKASDQQQETRIVDNIKKLESVSTHGKWCGYQNDWTTANSIITYDSLKYSSSNMNVSTPFNINTGNNSHAFWLRQEPKERQWRVLVFLLWLVVFSFKSFDRGFIPPTVIITHVTFITCA